ncbi:hypothetical protein OAN69_01180 [Alphaproteobacteria bacterium]|nr:hypothetical protein [Alphaproteobacteria bacterium]
MTNNYNLILRLNLSLLLVLATLAAIFLIEGQNYILLSILFVCQFFLMRPKFILEPLTVIHAFYALYIVVPSTLVFGFFVFDIPYQLSWVEEKANKWLHLSDTLAFHFTISVSFFIAFLYFAQANFSLTVEQRKQVVARLGQKINPLMSRVFMLSFVLWALTVYLFFKMGGPEAWFSEYSATFLEGRSGLGAVIYIALILSKIVFFSFGLILYKRIRYRRLILIYVLGLILFFGFVNGFKSNVMISLLLLAFPYLFIIPLKLHTLIKATGVFFILLFLLSYVRTGGYYSSLFLEMLIAYFDTVLLHDMILSDWQGMSVFSSFWGANKWLAYLSSSFQDRPADLSIFLTQLYFPESWYNESATFQWPIQTEIYLNYGNGFFQFIPLMLLAFYWGGIRALQGQSRFDLAAHLIFVLETIRVFTVLRSVMLHYELPVIIFTYVFIFIFFYVRFKTTQDIR